MSIKLKDTIYDLINKANKDGSGNTITSTYLNKTTGGTINGQVQINKADFLPLILNNNQESPTECDIRFDLGGTKKGYTGYKNNYGTFIYNCATESFLHLKDDGKAYLDNKLIYHSGNLTKVSQLTNDSGYLTSLPSHNHNGSYLKLSGGDTITGTFTMAAGTGIQMVYTSKSSTGDVWMYANGAPDFGIRYFEGDPDKMALSASGNNNTISGADLCINGNGDGTVTVRGKTILTSGNYTSWAASSGHNHNSTYVAKVGDTMTGTLRLNTNGTGSYNQGILINRTSESEWALIQIGGINKESGTAIGSWLVGSSPKGSSYNFLICENGADDNTGLCLGGNGTSTFTWKGNTIIHSGNYTSYCAKASHSHTGYLTSLPSHTHNYAGSSSAGGAATSIVSRTLWGQSFNGTANVDGTLRINGTYGSYTEGVRIYPASNKWTTILLAGTDNTATDGTSAKTWSIHNYDGSFYINKNGSNTETGNQLCNVSGNWGIGTSSPSYKLDINGTVHINKNLYIGTTSTISSTRATLDLITPGADATDFYLGADATRYWAITVRNKSETTWGSKAFVIYDVVSSKARAVFNTNGKVGIGSHIPEYPFHVKTEESSGTIAYFQRNATTEPYIYVGNKDGQKVALTWCPSSNNSYGACIYSAPAGKYLGIKDNGTPHFQGNTLIHAGNYTSYCAPASHSHSYLPLSGGTLTGTLHVKDPGVGNYTEGIRLYGTAKDSTWSHICFGCDPAATNGTHTNQWLLGRSNANNLVIRSNATDLITITGSGTFTLSGTMNVTTLQIGGQTITFTT